MFATNVRNTPKKCRSWAACHPRASENMHVQLVWRQFVPGWEFHPGQDRRGDFISCKHCKGFDHTQDWVQPGPKLTPGRNFSCKQPPEVFYKKKLFLRKTAATVRTCSTKQAFLKTFLIFTGKRLCWSLVLTKGLFTTKISPRGEISPRGKNTFVYNLISALGLRWIDDTFSSPRGELSWRKLWIIFHAINPASKHF